MRTSFLIGIECYTFPTKCCFSSIPQILVCCVFNFIQLSILSNASFDSTLTHELFIRMLFSFQIFGDFPDKFLIFSSITLLWTEKTYFVYFLFFYIFDTFLWPKIWSILWTIPCALKKNLNFAVLEQSVITQFGQFDW